MFCSLQQPGRSRHCGCQPVLGRAKGSRAGQLQLLPMRQLSNIFYSCYSFIISVLLVELVSVTFLLASGLLVAMFSTVAAPDRPNTRATKNIKSWLSNLA